METEANYYVALWCRASGSEMEKEKYDIVTCVNGAHVDILFFVLYEEPAREGNSCMPIHLSK